MRRKVQSKKSEWQKVFEKALKEGYRYIRDKYTGEVIDTHTLEDVDMEVGEDVKDYTAVGGYLLFNVKEEDRTKTYLKGTVILKDDLPAICIDWKTGVVREPQILEVSSSWRLPEIKHKVLDETDVDRSVVTPIPEYKVYPAFMEYLRENGVLQRWVEAGGNTIDL